MLFFKSKQFSLKVRTRFMKKLSFLLDAGIPFLQALHFIEEREEKKRIKLYLKSITLRIHSGISIHKSFATMPFIVDERSLSILESGEATGTLSKNCKRIGDDLETRLQNKNRLISALIYPACIASFAAALILLLLLFVFPKILPIITATGSAIPFSTRMLLTLSSFLQEWGLSLLVAFIVILLSLTTLFKKTKCFRKHTQLLLLRVPLLSKFITSTKSYSFAKLISLFLECGYTLSESLYFSVKLEKNLAYKQCFEALSEKVRRGERFSKSLACYPRLFPGEIVQFAMLGEESGTLSKTLFHLSVLLDDEMKEREKRMFSLLEPALMLVIGIIVGCLALSLVSPIYSLTSSFSQPVP